MNRLARRLAGALTLTVGAGLAVANPALAHIDPDPTEAQAGSQVSVGFTVEHGCTGSPTVQLDMRLPEGVAEPVPEPPDGWTGRAHENIVTFEGGPLPNDQELTFRVSMTLPPTPDTTIYFPFVQQCETGTIRWIAVPSDGSGDDPAEPAPAMQLFGPVATTATTPPTPAAATVAPATTTSLPAPTTAPPTTNSATSTHAVASSNPPTSSPTSVAADTSTGAGSGNSAVGTIVFIGVVVAVLAAVAVLILRTRRRE